MKIQYEYTNTGPPAGSKNSEKSSSKGDVQRTVTDIKVGHTGSEMYIRFDEAVIIMPPSSIKKLVNELRQGMDQFEEEYGRIKMPAHSAARKQSTAQNVVKALFKSRKVSQKLLTINTKRRKHLPFKDK